MQPNDFSYLCIELATLGESSSLIPGLHFHEVLRKGAGSIEINFDDSSFCSEYELPRINALAGHRVNRQGVRIAWKIVPRRDGPSSKWNSSTYEGRLPAGISSMNHSGLLCEVYSLNRKSSNRAND